MKRTAPQISVNEQFQLLILPYSHSLPESISDRGPRRSYEERGEEERERGPPRREEGRAWQR